MLIGIVLILNKGLSRPKMVFAYFGVTFYLFRLNVRFFMDSYNLHSYSSIGIKSGSIFSLTYNICVLSLFVGDPLDDWVYNDVIQS